MRVSNDERTDRTRWFLSWGLATLVSMSATVAVSIGAAMRFLKAGVSYGPPQNFTIGTPADFPFGAPTFLAEEKIFVFRDKDEGFSVASAECTHLGCTVVYTPGDQCFHCPCHGSVYGAEGKVEHGPAPRPLEWFEVTMGRDARLQVDKDRLVPASYRLLV